MTATRLPPLLLAWAGTVAALPWLWPWASPPIPAAPGLLASWGFTALLWLWVRWQTPHGHSMDRLSTALPLLGLSLAFAAWRMPVLDLALLGGWTGSLLCILVAAQAVRTGGIPLCQALCWGLLATACISSVLGLSQYLGLLKSPSDIWTWLHASPHEEAFGQLRQRNAFGSLMCLGLAAWLYLCRLGRARRMAHGLAWACLILLSLGAAASSSRTAALTWVAMCLFTWWRAPKESSARGAPDTRQGPLIALLVFLICSGLLPWLAELLHTTTLPKISAFERLASQAESTALCESRLALWRHVWELAWQRPWLGWGLGELDYVHATQAVTGERFCGQLGHAHHLPLHLAVEWGWPLAVLACLTAWLWLYRQAPWRATGSTELLGWSWLIVIGVHSALEFPLWHGPFQMVCGFALGAVTQRGTQPSNQASHAHRPVNSVLVGTWLICTLWAGWDYHRMSQVFLHPSQRTPTCQHAPVNCLSAVVWFHQARDFALLQQAKGLRSSEASRELARRVAHFAPEPWVLALMGPASPPASSETQQRE